jgi:hypothetical protein
MNIFCDVSTRYFRRCDKVLPSGRLFEIIQAEKTILISSATRRSSCYVKIHGNGIAMVNMENSDAEKARVAAASEKAYLGILFFEHSLTVSSQHCEHGILQTQNC